MSDSTTSESIYVPSAFKNLPIPKIDCMRVNLPLYKLVDCMRVNIPFGDPGKGAYILTHNGMIYLISLCSHINYLSK